MKVYLKELLLAAIAILGAFSLIAGIVLLLIPVIGWIAAIGCFCSMAVCIKVGNALWKTEASK